jgi:hypothetical protein
MVEVKIEMLPSNGIIMISGYLAYHPKIEKDLLK